MDTLSSTACFTPFPKLSPRPPLFKRTPLSVSVLRASSQPLSELAYTFNSYTNMQTISRGKWFLRFSGTRSPRSIMKNSSHFFDLVIMHSLLLCKSAANLRIGVRSEDLRDSPEKSIKGSGIALSSPRLVIPAAIHGLRVLSHQYFANDPFDFQLVPAMSGVFVYQAAALVQAYRDNDDLTLVFPDSGEVSSD